jgi:Skp family chaperone for outer membrane proteins
MMGGLVYANDEFIQHVDGKKREILGRYIENKAKSQFDDYYTEYKAMQKEVLSSYKQYQRGVDDYNRHKKSISSEVSKAWEDIESQVAKGWRDYSSAKKAYLARAEGRAQTVAPKIYRHFEDINRCIDRYSGKKSNASRLNRCITDEEKQYASTLKNAGIPFKDMDYWLKRENGKNVFTNEVAHYTPRSYHHYQQFCFSQSSSND